MTSRRSPKTCLKLWGGSVEGNKFLDAALEYIGLGMSVVILGKHGKKTTTVHTPDGLLDATNDPEVAKAWWELTPKCNVGIVCGKPSGNIIVVDIDTKHVDGYEIMRDWEMEHGDMPETVTCLTPTGGLHFYYRVDREVRPSANEDMGIDIRGDGSFAVAPPSIHPDTLTAYEWEFPPGEHEIAMANDLVYEFIEYVRPKKSGNGGNGEHVAIDASDFKEGGRNNQLYKMACSMMSQSWDDLSIRTSIETYNANAKHPLDNGEVEKIINSALKLEKGKSVAFYEGKLMPPGESPKSHVAIARQVMNRFSACYLDGMPAVFDGLRYRIGWDEVEKAILKVRSDATDKARNEVIKYLRLVMPSEKASSPRYIGFANGVLDVDTMELLSFSPEFRIPNVIPHDWNPDAQSDLLDATMQKIACYDPYIEHNLFEFVGLCMYRSCKYAYAAVLLGRKSETASNGKSTYIDLLRNVIGEDNYSVLDLNELGQRFQQGNMAGKLANLADDISSEFARGSNLTVFKKVVAGTEIGTDVKNRAGFKFVPYCTMVLSANKFPKLETPDDGVMRRLFPIRFNAHFTPEDPDFDPDIGEKLKSEECIEAAIVRGIAGLRRVIANKRPTPNAESESMANAIKVENSSILQWIEDAEITREDFTEAWTTKGAYDSYMAWCHDSGIRNPYGKPQFGVEVCSHFKLETYPTRDENRRGVRRYRVSE